MNIGATSTDDTTVVVNGEIKPAADEYAINDPVLQRTIDEVLKKITISRAYDIPYVAGYSNDGKTIYIDKDVPEYYTNMLGEQIPTDKFFIIHEAVEKAMLKLVPNLLYKMAHQIALRVERATVEAYKIQWDEYNKFALGCIKQVENELILQIPKDLDLTPYIDCGEMDLVEDMKMMMT